MSICERCKKKVEGEANVRKNAIVSCFKYYLSFIYLQY